MSMRPEIQERMDKAIRNTRLYNELFDLIVTTTEVSFSESAQQVNENQFRVDYQSALDIQVICNDNEYNTLTINVMYNSTDLVAVLNVTIHGTMEESYHNVPRAYRMTIYDYAGAVSEALEQYINDQNTPVTPSGEGE